LFFSASTLIPYHTSILTGEAWVYKLLDGHLQCIKNNLSIQKEQFEALISILCDCSFSRSHCGISIKDQLTIFLY
ncbi:hypothetical protein BKA82DRAFT_105180, partial [Pisolithus tinctorius]